MSFTIFHIHQSLVWVMMFMGIFIIIPIILLIIMEDQLTLRVTTWEIL